MNGFVDSVRRMVAGEVDMSETNELEPSFSDDEYGFIDEISDEGSLFSLFSSRIYRIEVGIRIENK